MSFGIGFSEQTATVYRGAGKTKTELGTLSVHVQPLSSAAIRSGAGLFPLGAFHAFYDGGSPKMLNVENAITAETITLVGSGVTYIFELAQDRIKPDSLSFSNTDPAEDFTDDADGQITGSKGSTGSYDINTGIGELTLFEAPSVAPSITDGAYTYYSDEVVDVKQGDWMEIDGVTYVVLAVKPHTQGLIKYVDYVLEGYNG